MFNKRGDFCWRSDWKSQVREDPVTRTRFIRCPRGDSIQTEAKTVRFGWLPGKDQKWAARQDWIWRNLKKTSRYTSNVLTLP